MCRQAGAVLHELRSEGNVKFFDQALHSKTGGVLGGDANKLTNGPVHLYSGSNSNWTQDYTEMQIRVSACMRLGTRWAWKKTTQGLSDTSARILNQRRSEVVMSSVRLYVISILVILGCRSMNSRDGSAEQRSRGALIAVADYVAARKGNERYAFSGEVYCGYPETCHPGANTAWDSMTTRPILARLRRTLGEW